LLVDSLELFLELVEAVVVVHYNPSDVVPVAELNDGPHTAV
jgi:hypothetical protein